MLDEGVDAGERALLQVTRALLGQAPNSRCEARHGRQTNENATASSSNSHGCSLSILRSPAQRAGANQSTCFFLLRAVYPPHPVLPRLEILQRTRRGRPKVAQERYCSCRAGISVRTLSASMRVGPCPARYVYSSGSWRRWWRQAPSLRAPE